MNRTEKELAIKDLNQAFNDNSAVFLFGFSGIDVPEITKLRRQVAQSGNFYKVVKNRLALRAAEETAVAQLGEHFSGPTAVALTGDDPVGLAKTIKEFIKTHPGLEFKAGVLDQKNLTADEVEQLADMPSRDELLSKVVYLLQSPLTQFAGALQSPLRNLASALKQLAEKKTD